MKQTIWLAAVVIAAAGALVGGTTTLGAAAPGSGSPGANTPVATAAEYYSSDMTLEEVSTASMGQLGSVAPPCPDVAVVTQLKMEGLPVGPCDPLPEAGQPVILPDTLQAQDEVSADAVDPTKVCAQVFINSTESGNSSKTEGRCGMGAEMSGSSACSTFAHWSDNEPNFPRGYAYIQDLTPSQWPVYTAAINWDGAPKLDLVYQTNCSGARCIPFRANPVGPAGCTGNIGVTNITTNGGVHITSASSRVDSDCSGQTANGRRELVCHEMGHAIGLNDRGAGADSCMRTNTGLGGQPAGSGADFSDLNAAYGHDS